MGRDAHRRRRQGEQCATPWRANSVEASEVGGVVHAAGDIPEQVRREVGPQRRLWAGGGQWHVQVGIGFRFQQIDEQIVHSFS